jgi:MinD superfamily P-loop ATPase
MKQLVILSGKGGTGKTSLAAAFAHLASTGSPALKVVLADADVDAANLELVLRPDQLEQHDFTGGALAVIDSERCHGCGICVEVCRFDAINHDPGGYQVDPIACEGCAACVYQCPKSAIHMESHIAGKWFHSRSCYGTLFHAELFPAQENSGKLVTLVKQMARLHAQENDAQVVIIDGPPGIGCPVIAAAAGADLALIVTEPTLAGVHDLKRILETTMHFKVPSMVVINKSDIYQEGSTRIEDICTELNIDLIGKVPFDPAVTQAMLKGEPVTAYRSESPASQATARIWQSVFVRMIQT